MSDDTLICKVFEIGQSEDDEDKAEIRLTVNKFQLMTLESNFLYQKVLVKLEDSESEAKQPGALESARAVLAESQEALNVVNRYWVDDEESMYYMFNSEFACMIVALKKLADALGGGKGE